MQRRGAPSHGEASPSFDQQDHKTHKPSPIRTSAAVVAIGAVVTVLAPVVAVKYDFEPTQFLLVHFLAVCVWTFSCFRPVSQPLEYHNFADKRPLCCGVVPNGCDVLSNVPFLFTGLYFVKQVDTLPMSFDEERLAWKAFFAGVALVSVGSAYYHWRPTNPTLVWDRLPMTISFMALFCVTLQEHIEVLRSPLVLPAMVLAGVLSVVYWAITDDLRFYGLVQFYPFLMIPYNQVYSQRSHSEYLIHSTLLYALAKFVEARDQAIFKILPVSGHTLKHLLAAVAVHVVGTMVVKRASEDVA